MCDNLHFVALWSSSVKCSCPSRCRRILGLSKVKVLRACRITAMPKASKAFGQGWKDPHPSLKVVEKRNAIQVFNTWWMTRLTILLWHGEISLLVCCSFQTVKIQPIHLSERVSLWKYSNTDFWGRGMRTQHFSLFLSSVFTRWPRVVRITLVFRGVSMAS